MLVGRPSQRSREALRDFDLEDGKSTLPACTLPLWNDLTNKDHGIQVDSRRISVYTKATYTVEISHQSGLAR